MGDCTANNGFTRTALYYNFYLSKMCITLYDEFCSIILKLMHSTIYDLESVMACINENLILSIRVAELERFNTEKREILSFLSSGFYKDKFQHYLRN